MLTSVRPHETRGFLLHGLARQSLCRRVFPAPGHPTATARPQPVLLERNLITPERLALASNGNTRTGASGQVLLDTSGLPQRDAVLGAGNVKLGVPATRTNGATVNRSAVQALPERIARKHGTVPCRKSA